MSVVLQAASEEGLGSMCIPETRIIYHSVVTGCDLYILFVLRNALEVKIKKRERLCLSCRDGLRHRLCSNEAPCETERWGGWQMGSDPALPFSPCWRHDFTSQIVAIPVPPYNWLPKGKAEFPWLDLTIGLNLQRINLRLDIISPFHPHRWEIWPSIQTLQQRPLVWIEPGAESCLHSASSTQVALNEVVTSLSF